VEAAGIEPAIEFDATHSATGHWFEEAATLGANTVHGAGVGSHRLTPSDIRLQIVIERWDQISEETKLAIIRLIERQQPESKGEGVPGA
jgi:hypothetical protein